MMSSSNWSKRLLIGLLPLLVVSSQTGCNWCRPQSRIAGALSDYWQRRAEQARFAEAKAEHERSKKAKAEAHAYSEGTVEEVVSTDYTITLEKGMEIESMSLDFDEIDKMKALQTKLDKEYAQAKEAYDDLVLDIERQRQADAMALARGEQEGANGCVPVPDCAQPPRAPALPPPPKRRALGTDNLPIVIRARYKLTPRQSMAARTEVERRFLPGKAVCEPKCCPQCGDVGCTDTGCCPPSSKKRRPSHYIGSEPYSVPASDEEASRHQRSNRDLENLDRMEFESIDGFTAGRNLFEGELEPITLSELHD